MQIYQQNNFKSNKKPLVFGVLGFLALILIAFVLMHPKDTPFLSSDPDKNAQSPEKVEEPKVASPLTGVKYSSKDAEEFLKTRPLGVMINNHTSARPQSGLNDADVVYEMVAEGGITRFLAFYNSVIPEKLGPVRSTREYYLTLVKEMGDAMIMHIGYSPQALQAIESWPVRSLSRGGASFTRDQARLNAGIPTEHTAYVSGPDLISKGVELGWEGTSPTFQPYKFKEDSPVVPQATGDSTALAATEKLANNIKIDFWSAGDYSAEFKYDSASNSYLRFMGYDSSDQPIPHKDQETGEQIKIKNLVVQFATETSIAGDDSSRLEYELVGSGQGIIFVDGKAFDVTWSKKDRDSRTLFYTTDGEEFNFNRGKFWISIVPDRNIDNVVYN